MGHTYKMNEGLDMSEYSKDIILTCTSIVQYY